MDKNYREIKFSYGSNIESAVNKLLEYKSKGELVCGVFNRVTLYSDTVTVDDAYKAIIGKTKAEFDKEQQERRERSERQKQKHKERIPELAKMWSQKGREVLTEDKWEYWDEIVPVRLGDLYHGMELGNCLDIIEILNNNGSLEDAKKAIEEQGHSGMSYRLVKSMVREFSDRGKEFAEFVS